MDGSNKFGVVVKLLLTSLDRFGLSEPEQLEAARVMSQQTCFWQTCCAIDQVKVLESLHVAPGPQIWHVFFGPTGAVQSR